MIFNVVTLVGTLLVFHETVANHHLIKVDALTKTSMKTASMRETTYIKSSRPGKKTVPKTHFYNMTLSSDTVFANNAYKYSILINGKILGKNQFIDYIFHNYMFNTYVIVGPNYRVMVRNSAKIGT